MVKITTIVSIPPYHSMGALKQSKRLLKTKCGTHKKKKIEGKIICMTDTNVINLLIIQERKDHL